MKPGSTEAIAAGCTCPVLDNAHGAGVPCGTNTDGTATTLFWLNNDCPLHCPVVRTRFICERCGGTGTQEAGLWQTSTKDWTSEAGTCERCDGEGLLGEMPISATEVDT